MPERKLLIISFYDSGFGWAIQNGKRKYYPDDYEDGKIKFRFERDLAEILTKEMYPLPKIIEYLKSKSSNIKLIYCENGDIEIIDIN